MQGVRVAKEDVDVLNLVADEVEEAVTKRFPDLVLALPDHNFVFGPELSLAVEGARAARSVCVQAFSVCFWSWSGGWDHECPAVATKECRTIDSLPQCTVHCDFLPVEWSSTFVQGR